jgi:hypothetical protein
MNRITPLGQREIFFLDIVENQAVEALKALGYPLDTARSLPEMYAEGKQSTWELHVRSGDPELSAALANIWAQKSYEALNIALLHAIKAEQLQNLITAIRTSQTLARTSDYSDLLLVERKQSKGLISIMQIAVEGEAEAPEKPVIFNQATLVFAGAFISLLLALWVVNGRKVPLRG